VDAESVIAQSRGCVQQKKFIGFLRGRTENHFGGGPMARFSILVSLGCVVGFCLLVIAPAAQGQVTAPSDFVQAPIPGAGHDYINLLSETVNPADGSVNLDFKLPTPEGRGVSFPFSLTYNSGSLLHFANFALNQSGFVPNTPWSSAWSTSLPYLSFTNTTIGIPYGSGDCYYSTGYEFYDLDRRAHNLYMSVDSPSPDSQGQDSDCSELGSQIPNFETYNYGFDSQVEASFNVYCGDGVYNSGDSTTCNNAQPPVTVFDGAGRIYSFNPGVFIGYSLGENNSVQQSVWPNSIEDRNGNLISFSGNPVSVKDTAGRTVVSLNNNTSPTVVSAGGLTYSLAYEPASFSYSPPVESIPPPNPDPSGTTCAWATGALTQALLGSSPTTVRTLTLPNNKAYSFTYDPTYGVLNEIQYPDGGWVKYTWGFPQGSPPSTYSTNALFAGLLSTGGPWSEGCSFLYSMPVVTTRQVGFGGSTTPVLTQTFSYVTNWNSAQSNDVWTTKTTTVTTTDNITNRAKQTIYTYSSIGIPPAPGFSDAGAVGSQIPVEQTVQYYDWGNTTAPIRTDAKVWIDQFNLKSDQTTIGTQTSEVSYTYGFGGAVTQKNEYDFGGALLRQTVTNYQAFPVNPLFAFTSVYSSPTLLTSPCQTIVEDGNGNHYAETDYFYDNRATTTVCPSASAPGTPLPSAVTPALVAGTHDEPNYSASSTISRGNLTHKTQWGSAGSSLGNPSVTTYSYDETGQIISMTDPCGNGTCSDMSGSAHTTTFSYTDAYSSGTPTGNTNTYLTKMTDPLHTYSFTYSYSDGHLTSSTDANSQITNYKYNTPPSNCSFTDGLDRLSEVDHPDNGKTTYCYNDSTYNSSTPSPSVTTTTAITSTLNKVSTAAFDGMGHSVGTILSSDPDGTTYTATTYDGLGNPYQVWNPYRTTSETSYGFTTHLTDGIGRTCLVVPPDFAASAPTSCPASAVTGDTFTSYNHTQSPNGYQITVTDATGAQRTSQTDGLGRLTYVWEAPNNSNYDYQTQYIYDPLNDVLSVNQNGSRGRTYTYDSLSRLLCAANPEVQNVTCPSSATGTFPSGAITYAYDANSNPSSKVAPQANQATGTGIVTTSYSYDVLNRLTQKSYVGVQTQTVKFGYDGNALTACGQDPPNLNGATYLIGRRSAMCAGESGSNWSFDQMGRPLIESRINSSSKEYKLNVSYAYNLDGSLKTLTYPSGDVVTYTVGGTGRTTQVSDSANSYVSYSTTTTNPVEYAPNGSLASMTNGYTSSPSFAGIVTSNIYNDRLQPILLSASVGSTAIFSLCYDFHLGVAINCPNGTINAYPTGDNGNVFQVLNNLDSTRTAVFAYDPLNRISQANTVNISSSNPNCWGEVYTIDAWSNLTGRAGVSGMAQQCVTELLSQSANSQNHLTGLSYDIAGNVLNDGNGNTPTYDAENRIATDAGVTYYYDASGVRMEKSSGTMYWPSTGGQYLTETNITGTINEEYIYFDGQRIARVDRPSGTVHYYFSNHLGSASVVTNATGSGSDQTDYYPFGGVAYSNGGDPNHYKFTGKERDTESNLDNFGARYFASTLGRFMTPDWAARPTTVPYAEFGDPQSLNLYSYVRNDPVTRADADGHCDGTYGYGVCYTNPGNRLGNGDQDANRQAGAVAQDGGFTIKTTVWEPLDQTKKWWNRQVISGEQWSEQFGNWWAKKHSAVKPYITAFTDIVGLVSAVLDKTKLGYASGAISVANDPDNIPNTALRVAEFLPEAALPASGISAEADLLNFEVQTAGEGMFEASPAKMTTDDFGNQVQNPAEFDEGDPGFWGAPH
jgi:RHS repeat-associated protein